MSRLIDELNRVARVTAQPMGFGAFRAASSGSRILLIASLAQSRDTNRLAEDVEGADAVLLRLAKSALSAQVLQKIAESLPDIPWGGWLEDINAKKTGLLIKAGCDFTVFTADNQMVDTPQDDKVGRILQVESSLGDGLLRAINDLPVDAVLSGNTREVGESMAWHHLMLFQRLANLLTKPLLVSVSSNITASELKKLWEAGVDGLVVEVDTSITGGLKELRRAIDKLPPRSQQKRDRMEALLPRTSGESRTATPPDEEEEEEYE